MFIMVLGYFLFICIGSSALGAENKENLIVDYQHTFYGSFMPEAVSLPASERTKIAVVTEAMLEIYGKAGACVLVVTETDFREGTSSGRRNAVRDRVSYIKALLVRLGVESRNISNPISLESQANGLRPPETKPTYGVEFYSCALSQ